jgi:predicted alpha/beta hydrolase family esterase
MARLDEVVQATPGPLRLAAHSLGAHLVAAWAAHSRHAARVDAALLVAPPDLDAASLPPALHRWRPAVLEPLPFRSLLVASDDDPYATVAASQRLASAWRADERLVACGGHLNAASGLADWPQARAWLLAL